MFIAALFIIARTWIQARWPSTWRVDKENVVIYTMEYYSVVNNDDILKFVGKWIDLENIILSEVTQTQKDK